MNSKEHSSRTESSYERLERGINDIMEISPEFQLDPFRIEFELCSPNSMHGFAAYGVPNHFRHWNYGRSFHHLKTMYDYQLARLYEMVVNADPAPAYLLESNSPVKNMMVSGHVVAHVDFFKNNYKFEPTTRDMPHLSYERARRIRSYEQEFGALEVERFLDMALSLAGHIEPTLHYRPSKDELMAAWREEYQKPTALPKSEFDMFMKLGKPPAKKSPEGRSRMRIPLHPDRDLLGFLRDFAPDLEDYQRDLIDIVREDSYYFEPQMKTKISNEGWAVIFHKQIMHELARRGKLTSAEAEAWWALHADVAAPKKKELNPYFFGMVMWEFLADYYNGLLEESESIWLEREQGWPRQPRFEGSFKDSPAIPQLRRIMKTHDDMALIRNYFNYVSANRMQGYWYDVWDNGQVQTTYITTTNWQQLRDNLLKSLDNRQAEISVIESNFKNQGELVLEHNFAGLELELAYAERVLVYVNNIWGRKIHLITRLNGEKLFFTCDESKVERHPMPK